MPEWERVPLGEVVTPVQRTVEVQPGMAYRTLGVRWWGGGAYERQTIDGSQTAAKTLSVVHKDDLIINKIWVRHGSTAIAGQDVHGCAASNEFPTFELDRSRVIPEWLHYLTQTREFWSRCDALSQGTSGKNRIKPEKFLTIEIPLPPLPEQQRIVARVKGLVDKVEEARRLREESADLQTLLGQQWRSEQFAHFGTVQLADIVGEAGFQNGYSPTRSETGSLLGLSLSGIRDGKIDPSHAKPIVADRDCTPYLMQRGDVFVVRGSGSKDLVGQAAIYHSDEAVVFPDLMIRIRLDQAEIDPNYFVEYWNSRLNRDWLKENAKTTSGIWKVSQKQLRYAPIPLPKLDEQAEVVERLKRMRHVLDALYSETSITQYELQALPSAILAQAFAGAL